MKHRITISEQQFYLLQIELGLALESLKKTESMHENIVKEGNQEMIEISYVKLHIDRQKVECIQSAIKTRLITIITEDKVNFKDEDEDENAIEIPY